MFSAILGSSSYNSFCERRGANRLHEKSAIDPYDLTGDVTRMGSGEKSYRMRDILGRADAA
jgi:hypothetical protein